MAAAKGGSQGYAPVPPEATGVDYTLVGVAVAALLVGAGVGYYLMPKHKVK